MKTNFDRFEEISFDYVDDNNVTFVDGYTTRQDGKTLGYIVQNRFYPTDPDVLTHSPTMNVINSYITGNIIKKF
jgi:hypothetical protein